MESVRIVIEGKSFAGKRLQRALVYSLIKERGCVKAYDVLKALREMGLSASPSSVYNLLERMAEEGYLIKEGDLYKPGPRQPEPSALESLRLLEALFNSKLKELMELVGEAIKRYAEGDDETRKELDEAVSKCVDEMRRLLDK